MQDTGERVKRAERQACRLLTMEPGTLLEGVKRPAVPDLDASEQESCVYACPFA
jgi:hypothetical protein